MLSPSCISHLFQPALHSVARNLFTCKSDYKFLVVFSLNSFMVFLEWLATFFGSSNIFGLDSIIGFSICCLSLNERPLLNYLPGTHFQFLTQTLLLQFSLTPGQVKPPSCMFSHPVLFLSSACHRL